MPNQNWPFYHKEKSPFSCINEMLDADYCDSVDYVSKFTLKQLRDTKAGLQTIAYTLSMLLAYNHDSTRTVYNFANRFATGFHDGHDLFYETSPHVFAKNLLPIRFTEGDYISIEQVSGNNYAIDEVIEYYNNLPRCYASRNDCIESIANIMNVLNIVAHLISRMDRNNDTVNYCSALLNSAAKTNVDLSVTLRLSTVLKNMPITVKKVFCSKENLSIVADTMLHGDGINVRLSTNGEVYISNLLGIENHTKLCTKINETSISFTEIPYNQYVIVCDTVSGYTMAYNSTSSNVVLQGNVEPSLVKYIWNIKLMS